MYTCGPTVYRYAHVGNLRTYLLADLIRRALLYHGIEVFHVKNVTDVGHLRDERFDRGEDRMLVQAGLESKTPAEIAAAYEAAWHADEAALNILPAHVFPRATEHIAEMVALAEELEDRGHAYATTDGNVYYSVGSFAGLRAPVGQHARRAARRSSRRGRAGQARPGRLRVVEGGRRGPAPEVADRALGRRLPGLASRVLGDGDALPRPALRHPHRRHRQRLPPPRGRDRPVRADRRRPAGAPLGPRRVPADGRQEDGQVRRQLPARDGVGRPWPGPAGVPLPRPDLALRSQAVVLGRVARRGRGGARVAAGRRCARWVRRRSMDRGPHRRCSVPRRPATVPRGSLRGRRARRGRRASTC